MGDKIELLTVRQAAERLSVSEVTTRRMLACGELREVRIRRAVRVPAESVEAYLAKALGTDDAA